MTVQVIGFFCEDIRQEMSGQMSIVGVLPDNIQLPPRPAEVKATQKAMIPKLGLYVRIRIDFEYNSGPMEIKLRLPDGVVLELGKISDDLIELTKKEATANNLPFAGIVHHALFQGFAVPQPGLITCFIEIKGEQIPCAILNAQQDSTSTASQPHA